MSKDLVLTEKKVEEE